MEKTLKEELFEWGNYDTPSSLTSIPEELIDQSEQFDELEGTDNEWKKRPPTLEESLAVIRRSVKSSSPDKTKRNDFLFPERKTANGESRMTRASSEDEEYHEKGSKEQLECIVSSLQNLKTNLFAIPGELMFEKELESSFEHLMELIRHEVALQVPTVTRASSKQPKEVPVLVYPSPGIPKRSTVYDYSHEKYRKASTEFDNY
jgi:hypothetical protein